MRVVFHLGYPRTVSSYLLSGKKGQSFCGGPGVTHTELELYLEKNYAYKTRK